jgi:hypothetical protein
MSHRERKPVPPQSYVEESDMFILNAGCSESSIEAPGLVCVIDLQEQLGACKCTGLVSAIRASLIRRPNIPTLFILWPDAGTNVLELQNIPGERHIKVKDGGQELFDFWVKHGSAGNIEIAGINLNVCIFNAIAEFLEVCKDAGCTSPVIHLNRRMLADDNYLDNPQFGWDHFRHVLAAYCPNQGYPQDTAYIAIGAGR